MPARDYFADLVSPVSPVSDTGRGTPPQTEKHRQTWGLEKASPVSPMSPVDLKGDEESPECEEPSTLCPACNGARWWQDRNGGWWCERCRPWKAGQWVRLVELPEGERPTPPPVTDEEAEAAVAVAARYGWSREAFREWCGGDWSGLPEPEVLEAMLRDVLPHPSLPS